MKRRIVILGCGYAGRAIAALARDHGAQVVATLRAERSADALRRLGAQVVVTQDLVAACDEHVGEQTHVVVAFPPDGFTDRAIARSRLRAASITYISSTGVYAADMGRVDDRTPVNSAPTPRARLRLEAEEIYRQLGATILRAPAIYGPDRGLHRRVLRGEHRIPGDGSSITSRVHVQDLAQLVVAAPTCPGETFVVGDRLPAPHIDVVRYIVETYGAAMPPFIPRDQVHETLRANRSVDASRALSRLGVTLRYPSYREGMAPAASHVSER